MKYNIDYRIGQNYSRRSSQSEHTHKPVDPEHRETNPGSITQHAGVSAVKLNACRESDSHCCCHKVGASVQVKSDC